MKLHQLRVEIRVAQVDLFPKEVGAGIELFSVCCSIDEPIRSD